MSQFQNFFATKLYADIGASDTTITLETAPTVTAGRLVLEARNTTQREIIKYTGVSGNDITGVSRGQGGTTAKSHLKNSLVEMNATAQDLQDLYDAFASFSADNNDWRSIAVDPSVASGYNKGNRSFELTYSSIDLSNTLSPGMRMKLDRGTTAPTQCADLEASSSQYATLSSPTGLTFTDDFTCEAWVKLESYPGSDTMIVARASNTNGWILAFDGNGRVFISGSKTSAANYRRGTSDRVIPLRKWVHIAATLDMSGTDAVIYMDGVSVPVNFTNGGTNPSSLDQTAKLEIGHRDGGSLYFDGKIADVRVWSDIRTATEIKDNMCQQLTGSESNLVGYWKLDGDFNDSTANANHLTASGSATATDTDNPFSDTEYAIVTDVSYSNPDTTVTVFTGNAHTIPNMTLDAPYYSGVKAPFGFPLEKANWIINANATKNYSPTTSWTDGPVIALPKGSWQLYYSAIGYVDAGGSNVVQRVATQLGTSGAATTYEETYTSDGLQLQSSIPNKIYYLSKTGSTTITTSSPTDIYLLAKQIDTASVLLANSGVPVVLRAECAYL